jgi:hypothetical protein
MRKLSSIVLEVSRQGRDLDRMLRVAAAKAPRKERKAQNG